MASEPDPRDLALLAEVRELIGLRGDQTSHNDTLQRWITSASDLIYKTTGREFIAENAAFVNPADPTAGITVAAQARVFALPRNAGYLKVGDLATLTSARYRAAMSVDWTAVDATSFARWTLEPLERNASRRPGRYIWLGGAAYNGGTRLEITGVWGWPAVPAAVRDACVLQVKLWYDRRIAKSTDTDLSADDSAPPSTRERRLASEVYDMIIGYRDPGPVFA